jgi:hypothetical protein
VAEKPPKMTRVVRSLKGPWGESVELNIPPEKLKDPTFVPRLSFNASPQRPRADAELARIWETPDYAFFIDANLANPREGAGLWTQLLVGENRVHLTPRVFKELLPYFERHPDHPLVDAIKSEHPSLVIHDEPKTDDRGVAVRDYYVELLARRRFIADMKRRSFERREGREPTDAELAALAGDLQREFGERGVLLSKKAPSPYFTDEHLVYAAVSHALRTGQPTMIVSGDYDVEEQFYKLVELLTRHYFSMCLADHYCRSQRTFRPLPIPPTLTDAKVMEPYGATVLDLGDRGLHDFVPPRPHFVPVGCLSLNPTYASHVIYGAEREMSTVLGVKERTRGLNTERLGGRNLHVWGTPPTLPPEYQGAAFICRDRRFPSPDGRMEISVLDHLYALWSKANHSTVASIPQSSLLQLP